METTVITRHPAKALIAALGLAIAAAGTMIAGCASSSDSREKPVVTDGPRAATLNGAKIAYTNRGTGDRAIVFVHGWAGNQQFWREQTEGPHAIELRTRRLITLDLPGCGQSDKPAAPYSMDLMAASVKAVMDDAGVSSAILVGHSNGTPVIRQFHRRYRNRVDALVVVDGSLRAMESDPAKIEEFIAPMRGPDGKAKAAEFIDRVVAPVKRDRDREFIRSSMLVTPQDVMVGSMEAAFDPAIWTDEPIDVPLLMLQAKSPHWDARYKRHVHALAPQVDYRLFDDVSHFLMMDIPEEFNEAMVEFLVEHGW